MPRLVHAFGRISSGRERVRLGEAPVATLETVRMEDGVCIDDPEVASGDSTPVAVAGGWGVVDLTV